MMTDYHTTLGHAHLKVRDIRRAEAFYTRFFDLKVTERVGDQFIFLSGSAMHHELALQGLGPNAPLPNQYGVGLYHIAFEVPNKRAFAQAYTLLRSEGVHVGAVDHAISWAMYFSDPDGNGLEIYVDTRHESDGADTWGGTSHPLSDKTIRAYLSTEAEG